MLKPYKPNTQSLTGKLTEDQELYWLRSSEYVLSPQERTMIFFILLVLEKDYPLTRALMTLMLCNKLQVDEYSVMADELLRKIFILANRSR
ncbi:hypothetical protein Tco_1352220 [Tanacetum coccineum]|uniref:Uncharacterized protein n=1 Tax=Tanacetum coccineum TaxID=301880 RepID=A0ABQ4YFK3_9ASTR